MKVSYENVKTDNDCSFCTIHINSPVNELRWEYHYHPEIELICVVSGSGTRQVGYHKSNYINGDLVLIGGNIPHSGFGLNATEPHEEIVIQFQERIINFPKDLVEGIEVMKLLSLAKLGLMFSAEVKNRILPKLYQLLDTDPSKRYIILLSILFELASVQDYKMLNKEIMPFTIISRHKERLQTIFTYIERNYKRDISILEISNLVNLALPSFCNFFKKATKKTFSDFLNQYRLDKACSLIAQGKTISEACFETGYNSLSYFSRTFKKHNGKTPKEFASSLIK